MKEEYIADDRVIIPEYIMKMTNEELDAEIERIKKEEEEKGNWNRKKREQNLAQDT